MELSLFSFLNSNCAVERNCTRDHELFCPISEA
jgi:hypothetical protein